MGFKLSQRSIDRMAGVHPDLVKVVKLAITRSPLDFSITEGLRTIERQRELVAQKKSQTMKSRHIVGQAVDICVLIDGKANWDFENYRKVADVFKACAKELGVSPTLVNFMIRDALIHCRKVSGTPRDTFARR